jgi:hypothetical protein
MSNRTWRLSDPKSFWSEFLTRIDTNLEFLPSKFLDFFLNLSQNLGSLDNLDSLEKEKFFWSVLLETSALNLSLNKG